MNGYKWDIRNLTKTKLMRKQKREIIRAHDGCHIWHPHFDDSSAIQRRLKMPLPVFMDHLQCTRVMNNIVYHYRTNTFLKIGFKQKNKVRNCQISLYSLLPNAKASSGRGVSYIGRGYHTLLVSPTPFERVHVGAPDSWRIVKVVMLRICAIILLLWTE